MKMARIEFLGVIYAIFAKYRVDLFLFIGADEQAYASQFNIIHQSLLRSNPSSFFLKALASSIHSEVEAGNFV